MEDDGAGGEAFRYKPALLARHQVVVVGTEALELRDDAGHAKWRLAWPDVVGAAFVEHTMRGMRMSRLDLKTAGRTRSFACTVGAEQPWRDENHVVFRAAVEVVARRLADNAPAPQVIMGEYGKGRIAMFVVGALTGLAGAGLAVAAVMTGRGDRVLGEAFVPIVFMLLMGLLIGWTNWPWRPRPRVPVRAFADALREAVPPEASPSDDRSR